MGCASSTPTMPADTISVNSKQMPPLNVKLHYFDIYGRAEPIRMLLWYKKIQYQDERYQMGTLPNIKANGKVPMEFGQLPVLEVNGKFFS